MRKSDHQIPNFTYQEDEKLDIKEIVTALLHYKKSIFVIVLIATIIAASRAYFAPSVYQSKSLMKISQELHNYGGFVNMEMYPEMSQIEDELVVFKSRIVAQKALEALNLGTRYYTTKFLRTTELYKDSPFIVTHQFIVPELYGKRFKIVPVDQDKFRLVIEAPFKDRLVKRLKGLFASQGEEKREVSYDALHSFSEKIETEWFSLSVQKISKLKKQTYAFTIVPNHAMTNFVRAGISTSKVSKSGSTIALKFTDTVPLRAQEIVNSVAKSYIDENLALKSKSAKKQLSFIDMQLKAIDKALKGSAEKLQEYKATNIVVDLSSKASMTATKLSELESRLYEINMQIDIMEGILNHIKSQSDLSNINMDYTRKSSPTIDALLEELQNAIATYATLSVNYTEKHPEIIVIKRKIISLKRSLKNALEGNLRVLKNSKRRVLAVIEEQKGTMKSFPEQEQKLGQLTRNFMINEKIYSFLLEKRAETAIEKSSTISNTRIIDAAELPRSPIKPKRFLIVLAGIFIGFSLGIGQAFLRIFLDDSIKSSEDIEKLTHVPLYGVIPLLKSEKVVPYYREAIRALWINLAFLKTQSKSKLVSITSTVSGEGKTLTIFHLSRMIAKNGNNSVIVLDLDMRKASLHQHFGLDNSKIGMSSLLADKCSLEEAIQKTEIDNLDVITSGPRTSNPTGLIMSIVLESIIEKLSQKYDYILLDTPPIGLVSDATKIIYLSDITLFVIRANMSVKEYIKEINRLNEVSEINLGIVLNGVDFSGRYGYGYKSEYMDGYLTH